MKQIDSTTHIGFIGTGVMGKSMARHLMTGSGCPLHVYTRTQSKAEELLAAGAIWEPSVAKLAAKCRVIFTIVGFPQDVEEVYLGPDGLINHCAAGSYVIDMTTSSPELARKIYHEAAEKGVFTLDAPVSGGDIGAREARLSIMAGGDEQAYQDVAPLLQLLGKNIVYQGGAGCGQHTKMCNQIVIAGTMLGVCEALTYAARSGLDTGKMLQSIESGAAASWTLSNLAPRIMQGNFDPGFYVKHFIKDMTIASRSAKDMGLATPGLDLAKSLYEELAEKGGSEQGTQALYRLYSEK